MKLALILAALIAAPTYAETPEPARKCHPMFCGRRAAPPMDTAAIGKPGKCPTKPGACK